MLEELKNLIPPPGSFLVHEWGSLSSKENGRSAYHKERPYPPCLDKRGPKIFATYAKGMNNAVSLLADAKLLLEHRRYARAVAVGITAWEELGKSQIAADYYSGLLSESEYKRAFKSHGFKTSYLTRMAVIGGAEEFATNGTIGERLELIRQSALYASETNDPQREFSEEQASFVLAQVQKHLESIQFAEAFNGRIGSKALFK